ncbi:hypothetical protein DFQ30_010841 [Apophysomyces sp. BC1015]|nr:hypothetical protein DFQ30_010841 [Apophysomyces sp. BC1015]
MSWSSSINGLSLLLLLLLSLSQPANTEHFQAPVINRDALGQLGFLGEYAGISPYRSTKQFESINPSISSVLLKDDDIYELITSVDGSIDATCLLSHSDTTDIYLAGTFTLVNKTLVNNIARFDSRTRTFAALDRGVDGPVHTLFCDSTSQTVYVGGDFTAPVGLSNNTLQSFGRSIAMWQNGNWSAVPWKGFNGPVYTISPNVERNTILFGGRFDATGDGQYFNANSSQSVNMDQPTIISSGNSALAGDYSNPNNIVCPNSTPQSPGKPWLLQDNVPGYWQAAFAYPVQPSLFRLSNAHFEGRGAQTFGIIAMGSNDYFQLSYVDPTTQQITLCSENCTLSNDENVAYQDFTVMNPISTSGIRIYVNSWFGAGGGLGNVQIFQSDIALHAHLGTTNPQCSSSPTASTAVTGEWQEKFVYGSYQNFLTATFPASQIRSSNASITYIPYVPAQGQYNVYTNTPGCVGSSSCDERVQIELLMEFSPGNRSSIIVDQKVTEDKITLIYSGFIASTSSTFQPKVVLRTALNATSPISGTVSVVADSLQFIRNSTGSALASILEYSPYNMTRNITPAWKPLAQQLIPGSTVKTIEASNASTLYIGGQFASTKNTYRNIVSYDYNIDGGRLVALNDVGVDGNVTALKQLGSRLFIGGAFTRTVSGDSTAFNNVACYDTNQQVWSTLEKGTDGPVENIVVSLLNKTVTFSGTMTHALLDDGSSKVSVGNIVWDVVNHRWTDSPSLIVGSLLSTYQLNEKTSLLAGRLGSAQTYRADGAAISNTQSAWAPYLFNAAEDGVINTGLFWHDTSTGQNKTVIIIGGRFQMGNISNLAMYKDGSWRGIGQLNGEVRSLAVLNNQLYIGGQFNGTLLTSKPDSFAIYDLVEDISVDIVGVHGTDRLPGLVNVIQVQDDGRAIYIGGNFSSVGSLNCASVCAFDTRTRQWDRVAQGLDGIVHAITTSNNQIMAVGNLSLNGRPTYIAQLNNRGFWTASLARSSAVAGVPTAALAAPSQTVIAGRRWYSRQDGPEPMPPWLPNQRASSLIAMLDAAQIGALGVAMDMKEKGQGSSIVTPGQTDSVMDVTDHRVSYLGAVSSLAFGPLMAAAASGTNTGSASEEAPHLYYAKYPFEAKEYGELGFDSNEAIVVIDTSDSVWWMGYRDDGQGKAISGLFPSNYVTDTRPI